MFKRQGMTYADIGQDLGELLVRRMYDLTPSRALTLWQRKNNIKLNAYERKTFKQGYMRGRVLALLRIAGNGVNQRNYDDLTQMDLILRDFVEHDINPQIGLIAIGAYVYVDVVISGIERTLLFRVLDVNDGYAEVNVSGVAIQIPIDEILTMNNLEIDVNVNDLVKVVPFDGNAGVVFRIDDDLAYIRFENEARAYPLYKLRRFSNDNPSTDAGP